MICHVQFYNILFFSFFFSIFSYSLAGIIHVPVDTSSIQGGIYLANPEDTVLVADNLYFENINFKGKAITLASQYIMDGDTNHIKNTIIDGSQPNHPDSGSVVHFISGEDSTSFLCGFTIRAGTGTKIGNSRTTFGGGIQIFNSTPKIKNIMIINNEASEAGGGIYIGRNHFHGNTTIEDITVSKNSSHYGGGGVFCEGINATFRNILVHHNTANYEGGGFYSYDSHLTFINTTISNNLSHGYGMSNITGGALYTLSSNIIFVNSILWYNNPDEIYITANILNDDTLMFSHSNLLGGLDSLELTEGSNSFVFWLDGNINNDPLFIDTTKGDYSLQELSPCIDKGIQNTLLNYNNNLNTFFVPPMTFNGSAPDMGAIESPYDITRLEYREELPKEFELQQNYPNPFNPVTIIEFDLPKTSEVTLKIYNILGEEVAMLVSDRLSAGSHSYKWSRPTGMASGVYLYSLESGEFIETKKMILMR